MRCLLLLSSAVILLFPRSVPALQPAAPPVLSTLDQQESTSEIVGKANTGVTPPKVLHSVPPKYSKEARKQKISGNVQLKLKVDENGKPYDIHVEKGLGHGLDENAIAAVQRYRFQPATRDGKPVKVELRIDVNFQIR